MKYRFLVTGGAGMIGYEVCRQLALAGHGVHLYDVGEQIERMQGRIVDGIRPFYGSILDRSNMRAAMTGCDFVIHLAAILGVRRTESDRLRCIEVNCDGTRAVLDAAVQTGIRRIIFASSSEVYGEPTENPITESAVTQGKTVYGVTKMLGEELCKAYSQEFGIEHVILRYFNCYGPYQTAQFVISKFIRNVMNGEAPVIYGDGLQTRSYCYVADTAQATILAATTPSVNRAVLNVGNSKEAVNLNELAQLVIDVGGQTGKISPISRPDFSDTDRSKEREIHQRYCDNSLATELLGWTPAVGLEEGIKRVFDHGKIFDRWVSAYDESN